MVLSCSVPECKNRHSKDNRRQFFRFPLNNNKVVRLWINAIGRETFTPSKYSKVCSDHFLDTDYLIRPGAYVKRIKPDAVPSLFPGRHANVQEHRRYLMETINIQTPKEEPMIDIKIESCESFSDIENSEQPPVKLPKVEELEHVQFKSSVCTTSATTQADNASINTIYLMETINIQTQKEKPMIDIKIESSESFSDIENPEKLPKVCEELENIQFKSSVCSISATTQTDNASIDTRPTKRLLRRKIKMLQQKVRRRDARINYLKNVIKDLKKENKFCKKNVKFTCPPF